ncbi:mating-type protein MAT alpha 1 domain-containing protein [Trichoderma austrokoningii]
MSREEMERHLSVLRTEEILHLLRDDTLLEIAERCGLGSQVSQSTFTQSCAPTFTDQSSGMNSSQVSEPTTFTDQSSGMNSSRVPEPTTFTDQSKPPKAKRPLNAFMAFRSYYLRLFPHVQQKTASGFLTTLWNKDPHRNKWALVAKVYSHVRDQLGRDQVSLSSFLDVACPMMQIVDPATYLETLGWSDDASLKLVQSESSIQAVESESSIQA